MPEKDGWGSATMVPNKDRVSPQANKSFGKGFDATEATNASLKQSTAKVSGPTNPSKGTNDLGHAGTMAPLKHGDTITANRPTTHPRSFEKA